MLRRGKGPWLDIKHFLDCALLEFLCHGIQGDVQCIDELGGPDDEDYRSHLHPGAIQCYIECHWDGHSQFGSYLLNRWHSQLWSSCCEVRHGHFRLQSRIDLSDGKVLKKGLVSFSRKLLWMDDHWAARLFLFLTDNDFLDVQVSLYEGRYR